MDTPTHPFACILITPYLQQLFIKPKFKKDEKRIIYCIGNCIRQH